VAFEAERRFPGKPVRLLAQYGGKISILHGKASLFRQRKL
jgi:hypothetical protein